MIRKIYHGGKSIVTDPSFGTGRPYNDFGLGFYCTESSQCAAEWAVDLDRNGFVSAYSLNDEGLRIINLCSSQYTPLHWLGMLFNYREFDTSSDTAYRAGEYINKYFRVDHQGCDCIIGYRADNRCFMFAQAFLNGGMTYQALRKALTGDDSNRQFVLKSNRAFDRMSFTGYEPALAADHYPVRSSRELRGIKNANIGSRESGSPIFVSSDGRAFGSGSARALVSAGGLFITDLIREEVRPYDARLR